MFPPQVILFASGVWPKGAARKHRGTIWLSPGMMKAKNRLVEIGDRVLVSFSRLFAYAGMQVG